MSTAKIALLGAVADADVIAAIRRAAGGNPLLGIGLDHRAGVPAERLCGASGGDGGRLGGGLDATAMDVVADLIDRVAARLGARERRVAASLVVLGYSARLVGPAVSALLREDMLLDLRPSNVRFAYDPQRGFSLDLVRPAAWRGDRAALHGGWHRVVIDDHLRPVVEAVRAVVPVAAGLLWGNVASGVAGALRAVASGDAASGDAASGDAPPGETGPSGMVARCHAEGLTLLDRGPLRGSGYLTLRSGRLSFARRTCCLYYRLDGGGMCGDCALRRTY
ncbi:MAG TPA: (2Fe-2S)-binding protein [Planosporangium sp.]|jgi:ferric iron reductase protein FhuF|nr:(2Fe-2S)-binding protein [Planosporangium sp.]